MVEPGVVRFHQLRGAVRVEEAQGKSECAVAYVVLGVRWLIASAAKQAPASVVDERDGFAIGKDVTSARSMRTAYLKRDDAGPYPWRRSQPSDRVSSPPKLRLGLRPRQCMICGANG
jgi:hypothetical protein